MKGLFSGILITVLLCGCEESHKKNTNDSPDILSTEKSNIIGQWINDGGDTLFFNDSICTNFFDSPAHYQLSYESCEGDKKDNNDSTLFLTLKNGNDFQCYSVGNISDSILSLLSLPQGRIQVYHKTTE